MRIVYLRIQMSRILAIIRTLDEREDQAPLQPAELLLPSTAHLCTRVP